MARRILSLGEKCVISFLLRAANKDDDYISKFLLETQCYEMNDGGMGSIRFLPPGNIDDNRTFGDEISSCRFTDADGVMVSAALYVDTFGSPLELDVWKVDFSRLLRMPTDSGELVLEAHFKGKIGIS